jgi:hypothetical protein
LHSRDRLQLQGSFTALSFLGYPVGSALALTVVDRIPRRTLIALSASAMVVARLGFAYSDSAPQIVVCGFAYTLHRPGGACQWFTQGGRCLWSTPADGPMPGREARGGERRTREIPGGCGRISAIAARRVRAWATIAPPGVVPGRHDARGGSMKDVRELLAEYGQCHSDEVSARDRHRLLVNVVAALIRHTDAEATVDYHSPDDPAVFFELAGRDYAITVTAASGTDAAESARAAVRALDQRDLGPGVRWVLVCARTPGSAVDDGLRAVLGARGVLLDRDHLEAAVCALAPLAALIRSAFRTPRPPYTPLHELLLQEPEEPAPSLSLPTRPSGPVTVPTWTEPGIVVSVVLAGEDWPLPPSGLAWASAERALITTEAGLAEVDLKRGGGRWRLPLPGVHGHAVVRRSRVSRFESCRGYFGIKALTSRNAGQSLSCTCQNAHGLLTFALFRARTLETGNERTRRIWSRRSSGLSSSDDRPSFSAGHSAGYIRPPAAFLMDDPLTCGERRKHTRPRGTERIQITLRDR